VKAVRQPVVAAVKEGLHRAELFAILQRAEVIDPATSFEDHKEEIDGEGTALGLIGGDDDGMDPEDTAEAPTDAAEAVDA
jgi:hypothetical protein